MGRCNEYTLYVLYSMAKWPVAKKSEVMIENTQSCELREYFTIWTLNSEHSLTYRQAHSATHKYTYLCGFQGNIVTSGSICTFYLLWRLKAHIPYHFFLFWTFISFPPSLFSQCVQRFCEMKKWICAKK